MNQSGLLAVSTVMSTFSGPGPTEPAPAGTAPRVVAFFDVDGTLLSGTSTFTAMERCRRALGRPLTEAQGPAGTPGATGGPYTDSSAAEAARACRELLCGLQVAEVARIGREWFQAESARGGIWNEQVLEAFRGHVRRGHLTVLVSGAVPACVEPIARHLGADAILCSDPETAVGRYTGRLVSPMTGRARGYGARRFMNGHGLDRAGAFAYADRATDLPLLAEVGNPVAVGDDPLLAAHVEGGGRLGPRSATDRSAGLEIEDGRRHTSA
jgi:HAD superfamily hydrolase (TIGR01490 family)